MHQSQFLLYIFDVQIIAENRGLLIVCSHILSSSFLRSPGPGATLFLSGSHPDSHLILFTECNPSPDMLIYYDSL